VPQSPRPRGLPFALTVTIGLALATGCHALMIKYQPAPGPAPAPSAAVAVQVVDDRPPEKQQMKNEVGRFHGLGIPDNLEDTDPNVVARTVDEATRDALKGAGVAPTGGPKTLVASVSEFWMTGFARYTATVTVTYTLQAGTGGEPLWRQEIKGVKVGASGENGANAMAEELFAGALAELARKASAAFKSPPFLAALGKEPR
jgi:hypothetical protein